MEIYKSKLVHLTGGFIQNAGDFQNPEKIFCLKESQGLVEVRISRYNNEIGSNFSTCGTIELELENTSSYNLALQKTKLKIVDGNDKIQGGFAVLGTFDKEPQTLFFSPKCWMKTYPNIGVENTTWIIHFENSVEGTIGSELDTVDHERETKKVWG